MKLVGETGRLRTSVSVIALLFFSSVAGAEETEVSCADICGGAEIGVVVGDPGEGEPGSDDGTIVIDDGWSDPGEDGEIDPGEVTVTVEPIPARATVTAEPIPARVTVTMEPIPARARVRWSIPAMAKWSIPAKAAGPTRTKAFWSIRW